MLQTTVRSDREVLAALRHAQLDIARTLARLSFDKSASAQVRQAQLTIAKRAIQARMSELWRAVGETTKARRLEAANRLIDLQKQLDIFVLVRGGLPGAEQTAENFAKSMQLTAESGLDRMQARVSGQSYKPLSDRVYNSSTAISGQLDRIVSGALAQGLSAKEFATRIRDFINPSTPGGIRYAALRLSRTEINNAAHAVAISQVADHPWVDEMAWHLSGSHPRPDACDGLASRSPYKKNAVPAKPHPQCFCFVVAVLPDEEEFNNALIAGKYDQFLERFGGSAAGLAEEASQTFESRIGSALRGAEVLAKSTSHNALPAVERQALSEYSGFRYNEINRVARGIGTAIAPQPGFAPVTTVMARMDRAFKKSPLAEDVEVWRGGHFSDRFIGDRASGDLTGFAWEERAYTSTSARQRQAEIFAGGRQSFLMRVLAPKGTPAISLSGMDSEAEVLLGRRQKFRVVADRGLDERGRRLLDVEVYT